MYVLYVFHVFYFQIKTCFCVVVFLNSQINVFLHLWFKSSHCRATELHVAIAPPTVHAVGDTVRSRAVAGI